MAWTTLTFAFGSLLTSTKMTQLYDNLTALANGDSGAPNIQTAAIAAGAVDSAALASLAVSQGNIKTTTGSVNGNGNLTLPGGEYGFYPQVKDGGVNPTAQICKVYTGTTYATIINLNSINVYAQQRYIQASPPYKIGNVLWGHFLFLLRKISTGEMVASYEAEDPPWAYNGATYLPKDDVGKMTAVPHPFSDYWLKAPAVDGLEIVMVDLSLKNAKKWVDDNRKIGKSPLEDLAGIIPGKGTTSTFTKKSIPNIQGFTNKIKVVDA